MIRPAPRLGEPVRRPFVPRRRRPRSTVHGIDCACQRCRPRVRLTVAQRATRVLIGLAIGQLLVTALDAAIGGPGPFVLFGF